MHTLLPFLELLGLLLERADHSGGCLFTLRVTLPHLQSKDFASRMHITTSAPELQQSACHQAARQYQSCLSVAGSLPHLELRGGDVQRALPAELDGLCTELAQALDGAVRCNGLL